MSDVRKNKFSGEVLSGRGEAGRFMEINWVREQCREITGFDPYPGTLNLKVDEDTFALIRRTAMSLGKRVVPPGEAGDYCEARLLPIIANGITAAVIYPMVNDYYTDIIEIIAPVLFKNIEGVEDGSRLELSLEMPVKSFRPSAVIFDLDGTLIDSVNLYYEILCEGSANLGVKPPQKEAFLKFMGEGLGFWEGWEAINRNNITQGDRAKMKNEIMNVFDKIFLQRYEQEVKLFPGVRELLLQFQDRGIKIGVVTSSFYIKKMDLFKRAGLDPDLLFAAVISRNDTVRKKPHPEPIYRCLDQMAAPTNQCLCVGDSPCDITAGKEAGLFTVGVLTGTGSVQSLSKEGADAVMDNAAELLELIE